MNRRKTYRAKFSNGEVVRRQTVTRSYTHAYLAMGEYTDRNGEQQTFKYHGFSTSAAQARKNMESELAWMRRGGRDVAFSEVVEVEQESS